MNIKKLYNKMTFWKNLDTLTSQDIMSICKQDFYETAYILVSNGQFIWKVKIKLRDYTNLATKQVMYQFDLYIEILHLSIRFDDLPEELRSRITSFEQFSVNVKDFSNLKEILEWSKFKHIIDYNSVKYALGQDTYNMLLDSF